MSEPEPTTPPPPGRLNPWLSIWFRPDRTIRAILDTDPRRSVLLLAIAVGVHDSFLLATQFHLGDQLRMGVLVPTVLGFGIVSGVVSLLVTAWLLSWASKRFGGFAAPVEVRAVVAWSNIPVLWTIPFWVVKLARFGSGLFSDGGPAMAADPVLSMLEGVEMAAELWSMVVLVLCLAEAQRFSAWRGVAAVTFALVMTIALAVALSATAGLIFPGLVPAA